jgi:hypothetical protein
MRKINLDFINLTRVKTFLNKFFYYVLVVFSLAAGFFAGMNFDSLYNQKTKPKNSIITKEGVNLAIDQYDNLLIIDRSSGEIKFYEDSVGYSIFHIYAKNMVRHD